ncbi:hypothetical protein BC936DRAFT_144453 [Jimgerdemannia flammicorona]|uniref:Uncharacterized protein n=2 Tax=Jimgerdemannia flammicorona TaxID=994334 RepID=A0A433QWG0_9FUNG|nr:hypothetical protein BC936DRAFT_144453 [Jimgerdemannia flammicorona]RUS34047.1 hypothetical protein BC938DRAFT_482678 [Jimgerdemannia flammicorona]
MISQYSRLLNYAPAARINLTRSTLQLANHHRLEHTPVEAKSVELIHRIDIRVGRILKIERHPDADSLYVEQGL